MPERPSFNGLLTNAGRDRKKVEMMQRLVDRRERNRMLIAARERDAITGNQAPEFITPEMGALTVGKNGQTLSGRGQFTFDPKEEKEFRADMSLRVKPRQYIVHTQDTYHVDGSVTPAGTIEREFDKAQLHALAEGKFCLRCEDRQPDDDHVRHEQHLRLRDMTGFEIPNGLSEKDCCCYCGGRLGFNAHL